MKYKKLLTNLLAVTIFLTFGLACQNIRLPFSNGSGINKSTDPKEAIQTAFKKFMDTKFYHSTVKTQTSQASVSTEVDFNAPDRYWIRNSISNLKNEVIAIGNDSYTRTNEGKWTKMPAGQSLPVADMREKMTGAAVASMKDFEAAGEETVNGKETFVYKFKNSYGGESASKMWISADTGLPLKVETEGNYSGNNIQMIITYEYDKEVKIEAPVLN